MKRSILAFLLVGAGIAAAASSDQTGDDTLRFYLSKSDIAVLGKIVAAPLEYQFESGVPLYQCEFLVSDVYKGDVALKGEIIKVSIKRLEASKKDKHPLVKKDGECILFLKNISPSAPPWETADVWFGVQQPSPPLAHSLKRLAAGK